MKMIKMKCLRDHKSGKPIEIPAPKDSEERKQRNEIRKMARDSAKRFLRLKCHEIV